jgi:hypothetical protein
MELLGSIQVRIERGGQTANEKTRIFRQVERGAVDFDDAMGESSRHGPLRRYSSAGRAWPELYAIRRFAWRRPARSR